MILLKFFKTINYVLSIELNFFFKSSGQLPYVPILCLEVLHLYFNISLFRLNLSEFDFLKFVLKFEDTFVCFHIFHKVLHLKFWLDSESSVFP